MCSVRESLVIICRKPCIGDTNSKRFLGGERGSRGTLRECGGGGERFVGKVTNAIDRPAEATAWWGLEKRSGQDQRQHDRVSKDMNPGPRGRSGVSFYTHLRM